jgi:hypothetical protein
MLLPLAAAVTLLTACGDDVGSMPNTVLWPATLLTVDGTPAVQVPETARVGQPFVVKVDGYLSGCGGEPEAMVTRRANRVEVRPMVRRPNPPPAACWPVENIHTWNVPLTIDAAGQWTIVVIGDSNGGMLEVTRAVTVTP